jgi:hypothetical protein
MALELSKRYLAEPIASDLVEKMVFLSGPRQVGNVLDEIHKYARLR